MILLLLIWNLFNTYDNLSVTLYNNGRALLQRQMLDLDSRIGFKSIESGYAKIFYCDTDKEYINIILSAFDLYYPIICSELGIAYKEDKHKIPIIIYPTEKTLYKSLQLGSNQKTPMGVYYGGALHILSPGLWVKGDNETEQKSYFLHNGPVVHEMIHLVLDIKTSGNFPHWFSEGVALFYEKQYINFSWEIEENSDKKITYKELTNSFRELDAFASYKKSFDVINYIYEEKGKDGLLSIIESLSKGKSFEIAFEKEVHQPVSVIDNI